MCKFPTRSQFHSLNHPNSLLLNNRLRKPYNNRRKRMFFQQQSTVNQSVLQSGEKEGMHTLDQDLARLVNKGTITFEDALVKVQVREEFEKLCGARSSF